MNIPPVVAEWADQKRRVLRVFRARRQLSEDEMQAAVAERIRDKGEPAPNKRIDVIMKA